MLQERNSDWAPHADRDGIVVVYPQGIDSIWNIGVGSPDVAYVGQVLDETEAALCIDTNRVYVDGFSLGAFLTSAIVCTYADRIAAVAPIAGIYMPVRLHTGASGSRAHDPRDARQLGRVHVDPGTGRGVGGAQRLRRDANPAPVPGDAVVNITKFTYDCPASAEVEFYSIENGGHAWPGSEFSRAIEAAVGYTTFAINATDLIWDFFRSHQLHPDIATYTARLSAAQGAFLSRIAAASGKSVADLVRIGVNALDAVADGRARNPHTPPPLRERRTVLGHRQLAGGGGGPHRCRGRSLGCRRRRPPQHGWTARGSHRVLGRDRAVVRSIVSDERESRRALRELIALLQEIDERYLGDEWSAPAFGDLYDGYRSIAHTLEGAFRSMFENDPRAAVLPSDRVLAPARCSATTRMRSTTPRPFVPT